MKIPDRSQYLDRPVFEKLIKPVAALLGCLALLVQVSMVWAGTVEYDLTIARQEVNFTGESAQAMTVNGQLPGPTLRFTEEDHAVIRVHNRMEVETSIHWHGILLPNAMDGVPFVTQPPIAPGQTFTYAFDLRQSGTYWYHSHTKLQEQRGLFGALVIAPQDPGEIDRLRDHVVVLSDWTDEDPSSVIHTHPQTPASLSGIGPTAKLEQPSKKGEEHETTNVYKSHHPFRPHPGPGPGDLVSSPGTIRLAYGRGKNGRGQNDGPLPGNDGAQTENDGRHEGPGR
jgi:FtsP/CotA-like multicopper oxidase with cupredoxin domain